MYGFAAGRPVCPIPEHIPCRFRMQGRCCNACFEISCPEATILAALVVPVRDPEWLPETARLLGGDQPSETPESAQEGANHAGSRLLELTCWTLR